MSAGMLFSILQFLFSFLGDGDDIPSVISRLVIGLALMRLVARGRSKVLESFIMLGCIPLLCCDQWFCSQWNDDPMNQVEYCENIYIELPSVLCHSLQ